MMVKELDLKPTLEWLRGEKLSLHLIRHRGAGGQWFKSNLKLCSLRVLVKVNLLDKTICAIL